MNPIFVTIAPTVFLRQTGNGLEQWIRVSVINATSSPLAATLAVEGAPQPLPPLPPGESAHDIFTPAIAEARTLAFDLFLNGQRTDSRRIPWQPPRHWTVHVVQLSHHDVGYTDLPSHVLPEHDRWLDQAIGFAAATRDYPEESQFRIIAEQAWSLDHYLKHASPPRVRAMLGLIRSGHVEVTALSGNLITELCGHETLIQALTPSARIARRAGVHLVSAEHNDIPGFTWGLAEVLAGAGVKLFCPGLPLYYNWYTTNLPSFWDEKAIFGKAGMPGAFWWEAPSGKKVLFWCNNSGCGGNCRADLPGLPERLQQLADDGYPYPVLRWPVIGGHRDNSPYIGGFCGTIRDWNARWAFPRLVSSTNARFYADLLPVLPADLPVRRGDVPGQDYPVGASSTARATAVNRRNHAAVPAAGTLAAMAKYLINPSDPTDRSDTIAAAYEETLWHDEHTWGFHFPCGPASEAHNQEKSLHALRAAALAHDVTEKSMALIADRIKLESPDLHLVVFNPLSHERTGLVSTPLRELDNCGSEMVPIPEEPGKPGSGQLTHFLLGTRSHLHPPEDISAGKFDLIDAESGQSVPFQLRTILSPMEPDPYAPERLGLAQGGRRSGTTQNPGALCRTLEFTAHAVPALGYRAYRLAPCPEPAALEPEVTATAQALENKYYRIELDPQTGGIGRLLDKRTQRDWIESGAAHSLGAFLVREPDGRETLAQPIGMPAFEAGPLRASLVMRFSAPGHPVIEERITLTAGLPRIDFAVSVIKDATPLLETYVAFPFHLPDGRFLLEEPLHLANPETDRLPGAYSNRLTVQNGIRLSGPGASLLWSSLDAPIVALGRLWQNRVSPAHACLAAPGLTDPPPPPDALRGGPIYSLLFANNFGTNFTVTQSGCHTFRYVFASLPAEAGAAETAAFGAEAQSPMTTILTRRPGPGSLPPVGGLVRVDNPGVRLLTLKEPDHGNGLLLRLWNVTGKQATARVNWLPRNIRSACPTSLIEEDSADPLPGNRTGFTIDMAPGAVETVRVSVMKPKAAKEKP
jgi:hypothetical protein